MQPIEHRARVILSALSADQMAAMLAKAEHAIRESRYSFAGSPEYPIWDQRMKAAEEEMDSFLDDIEAEIGEP